MSNFEAIKHKLRAFIKRFYINELLKGAILFFAIGLLYFIVTLFIEYVLWLNTTARTILFWVFITVEVGLFIKFIAIPLLHLFRLRKGIDYVTASRLIGNHFQEVNDKLLNVLQLSRDQQISRAQSDLLLASIEQKSKELKPVPFKAAINFKSNIRYLKYAAIPVAILLLSLLMGELHWFSDSYKRVVNYKTAYEPPAPFQFFVINESLKAIESKDFKLRVSTVGNVIPENAKIQFNGQSYFLQQLAPGQFQYTFNMPKEAIEFNLIANEVTSKPYLLDVIKTPSLINFEMVLDYPSHTKKKDEVLKSTGSAVIPEGTKVTWTVSTKSTTDVNIYAEDTLKFNRNKDGRFTVHKRLFKNYSYSISTSNANLRDYENLAYSISTMKDLSPELIVKMKKDSLDEQSLYFYGQATDDYGLSKLQIVYFPAGDESDKSIKQLPVSTSNFSEFVSAFPDQLNLKEGVSYQLYFEVFDNDVIHNYKATKSTVFNYRKRTKAEEEQKQLNEQSETIQNMSNTFEKLQNQDKKLEELSKTQKEKEALNFNDKKKFEDFLKRQKNQEQLMKNFNKKLQDNLEQFQLEKKEEDQFKEDLKQRLKENEEQLKKDEKLLEELEQLKDKINKEEFTQKLEELAKQNKNKKRSMKQLLELTKRFYVMKKTEKISNQLEKLAEEQEQQANDSENNTKKEQEALNEKFKELQKDLDELKREDRQLQKPTNIARDEFLEDEIQFDQNEAKDALEKQENNELGQNEEKATEQGQKARKKQKEASKKMKKMGEMLMQNAGGGGGGDQTAEDIDTLRQILENLLLYSFDQENLMNTFQTIDINNNKYGKYIIEQSNLKEHFEHIDDSLFALSLRQPKISEKVNSQITDVYFNIDKTLGQLTENRLYQGVASQQYAITASNELASFLSDVLDNMEMSMNPSPGSGKGGEQLQDIIMSQEELNKMMEEGLKKQEKGEKGKGEKEGKGEKPGEKGKDGKQGEGEKPGKEGQSGNQGKGSRNGNEGKQDDNGGKNGENQGKGNTGGEGKNGDGKSKAGYGEGGTEEQNAQLFKIYQQQQLLRQALQDKFSKENTIQSAGELIKQMEDIELDLLNSGFTNQTLQKMMDLQHQLLKLENATFMQGQDTKRKSQTNTKVFNSSHKSQISVAKQYFNTTEILNRQALPLQNRFKKKIQSYFKNNND
ncbi:MAG: hypothetical protein HKN40_08230 [Winogradskyella sp.]|uniref:hypothetical protein n=1 Tax=Winogradskyella sp. TaxID=1883156 RepID=UPI00182E73F9|nr:hypothetical protein [Winogradskyella sp.]